MIEMKAISASLAMLSYVRNVAAVSTYLLPTYLPTTYLPVFVVVDLDCASLFVMALLSRYEVSILSIILIQQLLRDRKSVV